MTKENLTTKVSDEAQSHAFLVGAVIGSGEFMKRNCHNCKTATKQEVKLYNRDNHEEGEVWECTTCKENTGWADR